VGNLEQFLPQQSKTVQAIYDAWKKRGDAEAPRTYLGASSIGHECSRFLWYQFRWCGREEFPGRIYRLFDHGDKEELRMVNDLRDIGCEVHPVDPETGEQFAISFADGHGGGHMDGCALGVLEAPKTWHVVEFKTHNAKSFGDLKRRGVQQSKPKHYAQMQVYMRKSGMERALYLAINKNTEDLYAERVKLDREFADSLLERADRIVKAGQPPLRAGEGPDAPVCKYCAMISLCHGNPAGVAAPCVVSCRSCAHSEPIAEGAWWCELNQKRLSAIDQSRACQQHLWAPGIITFAECVDAGKNPDESMFIEYMNEADNSTWRNGSNLEDGQFSSVELTKIPKSALHGKDGERIKHIKQKIRGEVVG